MDRVTHPPWRLDVWAGWGLALLIVVISLGGILSPAIYSRETPGWAAQAVGQDWVDLLFAAPFIAVAAAYARAGSRAGRLLLAGGCLYSLYELLIYAFAVRFNALFLVYCAALGLSVLAFGAAMTAFQGEDVRGWFTDRLPRKTAGAWLIGIGVLFSLLWLAEIVPALAHGGLPASVAEAGVPTNPVHVIDLSVVLPAHVAGGALLLGRRPLGYRLAPILLAFGVLMSLSIGGMMVVMRLRGIPAATPVIAAMAALCLGSAWIGLRVLRALR